jgi:hypothetical protein
MAATYELLKSATLTSTSTTISLTSIPQTYTDLVVIFTASQNDTGQVFMGSTTSNPSQVILGGVAAISSFNTTYQTTQWAPYSNYTVGTSPSKPLMAIVNIFNYKGGISGRYVIWQNIIGNVDTRTVISTSSNGDSSGVTAINFDGNTASFITGTTVRIYGILRA